MRKCPIVTMIRTLFCILLELHLQITVGTELLDRDLAAQAQIYSMVFAF